MLQIQFMRPQYDNEQYKEEGSEERLKNWHTRKWNWSTLYIEQKVRNVPLI